MRKFVDWAYICMALGFLGWAMAMGGCATSGADKARQVTTSSLRVLVDADESVEGADAKIKADLLDQVRNGKLTVDQAQAQFQAWAEKRAKVVKAATLTWDAIKTCVHVIDAVEAKQAGDVNQALADVVAAGAQLLSALRDAGVKVPGVQ